MKEIGIVKYTDKRWTNRLEIQAIVAIREAQVACFIFQHWLGKQTET